MRRSKPWETPEYCEQAARDWEERLREAREAVASGVAEPRQHNCIAIADSWIAHYRALAREQ